jgi:tetratricopeptide (TPR) repeat protein
MFSYPLNIPFVWLIIFFIILSSIPIKLNKSKNIAKTIVVLSLGSLCFYLIGRSAVRNIRRIYLQEHAMTIFDIKILEKYDTMYKEFSNDGLFLYNYAAMLHYYGDFRKSIAVFKDCSSYINDYNMMILMGDNYQQLNIPDSALKYYKRASEMIPNRFLPLYYQMTVYQEQDEMNKAKQIAEVIIHKENKIRKSKTIEEIIKRANDCLKK